MRKEIIGDCELYLGDCLEILPTLGMVDAVVTDPPYDQKTHHGAIVEGGIDFKPLPSINAVVSSTLEISKGWCLAFCSFEMLGQYSKSAGDEWVRSGIWDKITHMPQMTGDRPAQACEAIAIYHRKGRKTWNGGGRAGLWRQLVERGDKSHPTQKPAILIEKLLVDFTESEATILDPFMGSGTTGVACINLQRKFIGIEIEPKYFDIACKRIETANKQMHLFPATK